MQKKPDINRLVELQKLLFAFQAVERKLHIPPGVEKFENSVEHSYALAITAWFLASHFPHLNRDKLLRLALAHDVIEAYAGDTYAYDHTAVAQKNALEYAALTQLQTEWADFPDLLANIEEYEQCESREAKFIYALDKLLPALVDYLNEGRGWRLLNITFADFCAEKDKKIPLSPEINEYSQSLIAILEQQRHLFPSQTSGDQT